MKIVVEIQNLDLVLFISFYILQQYFHNLYKLFTLSKEMNTTIAVDLDKQDSSFGAEGHNIIKQKEQGPSRKLDIKIKMGTREHEATMVETLPPSQPAVAWTPPVIQHSQVRNPPRRERVLLRTPSRDNRDLTDELDRIVDTVNTTARAKGRLYMGTGGLRPARAGNHAATGSADKQSGRRKVLAQKELRMIQNIQNFQPRRYEAKEANSQKASITFTSTKEDESQRQDQALYHQYEVAEAKKKGLVPRGSHPNHYHEQLYKSHLKEISALRTTTWAEQQQRQFQSALSTSRDLDTLRSGSVKQALPAGQGHKLKALKQLKHRGRSSLQPSSRKGTGAPAKTIATATCNRTMERLTLAGSRLETPAGRPIGETRYPDWPKPGTEMDEVEGTLGPAEDRDYFEMPPPDSRAPQMRNQSNQTHSEQELVAAKEQQQSPRDAQVPDTDRGCHEEQSMPSQRTTRAENKSSHKAASVASRSTSKPGQTRVPPIRSALQEKYQTLDARPTTRHLVGCKLAKPQYWLPITTKQLIQQHLNQRYCGCGSQANSEAMSGEGCEGDRPCISSNFQQLGRNQAKDFWKTLNHRRPQASTGRGSGLQTPMQQKTRKAIDTKAIVEHNYKLYCNQIQNMGGYLKPSELRELRARMNAQNRALKKNLEQVRALSSAQDCYLDMQLLGRGAGQTLDAALLDSQSSGDKESNTVDQYDRQQEKLVSFMPSRDMLSVPNDFLVSKEIMIHDMEGNPTSREQVELQMAATSRSPLSTDGSPMVHVMHSKLGRSNPFTSKDMRQQSPDQRQQRGGQMLNARPSGGSMPNEREGGAACAMITEETGDDQPRRGSPTSSTQQALGTNTNEARLGSREAKVHFFAGEKNLYEPDPLITGFEAQNARFKRNSLVEETRSPFEEFDLLNCALNGIAAKQYSGAPTPDQGNISFQHYAQERQLHSQNQALTNSNIKTRSSGEAVPKSQQRATENCEDNTTMSKTGAMARKALPRNRRSTNKENWRLAKIHDLSLSIAQPVSCKNNSFKATQSIKSTMPHSQNILKTSYEKQESFNQQVTELKVSSLFQRQGLNSQISSSLANKDLPIGPFEQFQLIGNVGPPPGGEQGQVEKALNARAQATRPAFNSTMP